MLQGPSWNHHYVDLEPGNLPDLADTTLLKHIHLEDTGIKQTYVEQQTEQAFE
jgi:hypothetical protein